MTRLIARPIAGRARGVYGTVAQWLAQPAVNVNWEDGGGGAITALAYCCCHSAFSVIRFREVEGQLHNTLEKMILILMGVSGSGK